MKRYYFIIISLLTITLLASCGGGGGSSSSTASGKTTVSINIGQTKTASPISKGLKNASSTIPSNVASIKFTISAADMTTIKKTISVSGRTTITESFEVSNGSNRHFLVEALDSSSNVLYRGDTYADLNGTDVTLTIVVVSTDTIPPTFSGLSAITSITETSLTLSWSPATDSITSQGNIQYLIYVSTTSGGENFATPSYTTSQGATSFNVTGLSPNTTYYFVVRAKDEAGNIDTNTTEKSAITQSTADTTPPTFGGIVSATALSSTEISLTWNAATDNVTSSSNIVYLIYMSATSGGENFAIPASAVMGTTSMTITGLAPSTTYYFVIRAADEAGNIDSNTVETSATTKSSDTTSPTVVSTSPADGATKISVTSTITATFSETIDSSTIDTTTFTLKDSSGNPVSGTVTYSGTTATFTPSTSLSYSTTYTATITTGVKDLAGNAMASNYGWTFTTEASTLVKAHSKYWSDGYYVQFSYYDPSYTATSVSVAGYGITGSLTLTYNTTKGQWDSYTSPSNNLYLGTAYPTPPLTYTFTITDSTGTWTATDTVDCFMTEFATTLSPLGTVTTTTPTFSWTKVSQTTMEYQVQLNDSSGNRIWDSQTGVDISSVTYNGPSLTSGATYYYNVVANPQGGDCESFASGSFTYSPGTTSPTVVSTSPVNGAINVSVYTTVTATFSESVDCTTVNNTTFLLSWGGGSVAGTTSCSVSTATFTSSTGSLSNNTIYTATITTGVKDLAGNAMTSNYIWSFTTVEFYKYRNRNIK